MLRNVSRILNAVPYSSSAILLLQTLCNPAAVLQKMCSVMALLLLNYVEHHIAIFSANSGIIFLL
jgi:hypothetical protein